MNLIVYPFTIALSIIGSFNLKMEEKSTETNIVSVEKSYFDCPDKPDCQMDRWFFYLLRFFELCGFHHSAWTHRQPVKFFIFTLQLITLYIFTVNGTKYILAIAKFMKFLGVFNFALFYFALLSTYWIIVIETHTQKSAQDIFWKLGGFLNDFGQRNSMKRVYLCEFLVHVVLTIMMLSVSMQDSSTIAEAILIYYVLIFMCNNRLLYFLLYLKIIKIELQHNKKAFSCSRRNRLFAALHSSSVRYQRIYEIIDCINRIFGWSQFATILICFYTLVTYLNFIYQQLDLQFEEHGLFFYFGVFLL